MYCAASEIRPDGVIFGSMAEQAYSPNVEEYLEELYRLSDGGESYVSTGDLADRLGIKAPSVTEMLGSLAEKGLVEYEPYRGALLTEEGRREGGKLLEKHRLVERLLTDVLGLDWSEVHDEACELEHAISDKLEGKIREALEDPETCPHGKPMSGTREDRPLGDLEPGDTAVISSVSDDKPELLRRMTALSLGPGTEVEVSRMDEEGVVLRVDGREVELGGDASRVIRVEYPG